MSQISQSKDNEFSYICVATLVEVIENKMRAQDQEFMISVLNCDLTMEETYRAVLHFKAMMTFCTWLKEWIEHDAPKKRL